MNRTVLISPLFCRRVRVRAAVSVGHSRSLQDPAQPKACELQTHTKYKHSVSQKLLLSVAFSFFQVSFIFPFLYQM
ncbi:hypothetical protein EXN66_Car021290 [Channa argus]|uniref:Uncharacterized protein n=1 Tax=Channa argus TaxID=215402 RepID=A0A6G1QTF6_CHAAH|nr:hypothetical protein EXN66_Car021290 [Channa argus]